MGQKGHIMVQKGLKMHKKRQKIEFLDLKRRFFRSARTSCTTFDGPRPVPSRPALKIWITYIQAYMPYESCKDSSNQPYGPMASLGCPLDPLGPPGNPPIDPLRPINRSLGLIALLRSPQLPHKSHSPSTPSPMSPRHPCHRRHRFHLETLRP